MERATRTAAAPAMDEAESTKLRYIIGILRERAAATENALLESEGLLYGPQDKDDAPRRVREDQGLLGEMLALGDEIARCVDISRRILARIA